MALFVLRREQGRLAEIEQLIRESIDEYAGYRSFRCLVPLIACELGRPDEAASAFAESATDNFSALPRDAEWLFCLSILAEVAVSLGDTDRGAELYRQLLPYESLFALASGEVSTGCVARYLGILATLAANWTLPAGTSRSRSQRTPVCRHVPGSPTPRLITPACCSDATAPGTVRRRAPSSPARFPATRSLACRSG